MGIWVLQFIVFVFLSQGDEPISSVREFSDFKTAVLKSTNVEDFLSSWKQSYPDYFSNYVMAYRSRSLQNASPEKPRVIMFNKGADLVISFNSHASARGNNNLEVMRFNDQTAKFEFYEVGFKNKQSTISEPNPAKCLECHQSSSRKDIDPRPNWEPYNKWLGFYGSLDDDTDLFKTGYYLKKDLSSDVDKLLFIEFDNETAWHQKFKQEIQPNDRRYKFLNRETTDQYGHPNKTLNGDFTNRISKLNFKRIARLMKESKPVYDLVKWTGWAYANCGQTLYMKKETSSWLYAQVNNQDLNRRNLQLERNPPNPSYMHHFEAGDILIKYVPPEFETVRLTDAINILFEAFAVNTEDWSMDFKTDGGRFAAFERFGVTNDGRPWWRAAIEEQWDQYDLDLQDLNCEKSKNKSLEAFSNLEKIVNFRSTQLTQNANQFVTKPLLSRCISCHVGSEYDLAPAIPFDDPQKLSMALKKEGYKRGTLLNEILYRTGAHATETEQMPPRGVPTTQQREELHNYLRSL